MCSTNIQTKLECSRAGGIQWSVSGFYFQRWKQDCTLANSNVFINKATSQYHVKSLEIDQFPNLFIQGGPNKPDCFWEWITLNRVETEMWIICHLVKKLVENIRIIIILHTYYLVCCISNKNWVKLRCRHYRIVVILRYMTVYAN